MYSSKGGRNNYCEKHLLGDVPEEMMDFPDFYEARKERLRERIGKLLERTGSTDDTSAPPKNR